MAAIPNSTTVLGRHGRLELGEVLVALIADGLLAAEDAKRIRTGNRAARGSVELHPLVVIASAKPENRTDPGKPLTVESLT
ncbi:MAG: type II/IV secretion system protein, partial [Rhodanobacteraceae bacterium]